MLGAKALCHIHDPLSCFGRTQEKQDQQERPGARRLISVTCTIGRIIPCGHCWTAVVPRLPPERPAHAHQRHPIGTKGTWKNVLGA